MRRDAERLAEAERIFAGRDRISAEGLHHLAMLFQHGQSPEDFKKAFDLASESAEKGNIKARWLSAAAEDRYLLSIGKPQKWGTQFLILEDGTIAQRPMDSDEESGITDDARKEKNVPPRATQLSEFIEGRNKNSKPASE